MLLSYALALFAFGPAVLAATQTVSYDTGYDDATRSLTVVSCSDGNNGLITRYGWHAQGEVAGFPGIAGVAGVSWNSPLCGTCWSATYNGKTVYVLAVDSASAGINMSKRTMDALTGGRAVELGRINADVNQVATSFCGITA